MTSATKTREYRAFDGYGGLGWRMVKWRDRRNCPGVVGAEEALFQWLLVTLTAGVGGSLLSVGSAAGVALMGTAHGKYTFTAHLRWAPVILIGYFAAVYAHYLLNHP